jgi:hypothetical protein
MVVEGCWEADGAGPDEELGVSVPGVDLVGSEPDDLGQGLGVEDHEQPRYSGGGVDARFVKEEARHPASPRSSSRSWR